MSPPYYEFCTAASHELFFWEYFGQWMLIHPESQIVQSVKGIWDGAAGNRIPYACVRYHPPNASAE
jgi:hypothetical protein